MSKARKAARAAGGGVMTSEADLPKSEILEPKAQELKVLAIEKVVPSKTNPRKYFDPEEHEKMVASVKSKGILNPLNVRPMNGHFELVAGERRWRAAKAAGLKEVPVLVRELTDDQVLEVQLLENVQRQDLQPLELCAGFRALLDRGMDVKTIAWRIGRSSTYVHQTMRLVDLAKKGMKLLEEGQLKLGSALRIAPLPPAEQAEVIDWFVDELDYGDGPPTEKDVADHIAEQLRDLGKAPWDLKDEHLLPGVPSCTACPKRTGNSPDLFTDIRSKERCIDGACFKKKMERWSNLERARLEEEGVRLVKISEKRTSLAKEEHGAGTLGHDRYKVIEDKKECDHTAQGYRCDGEAPGTVIKVCTNQKCKVHHPEVAKAAASEVKYREQREERKEKDELERQIKLEAVRQICGKLKEVPRRALELCTLRILEYGSGQEEFGCVFPGLDELGTKRLAEALRLMPAAKLSQVFVAALLAEDIGGNDYSAAPAKVSDFAVLHKVNLKSIETELRKKSDADTDEVEAHKHQVKNWRKNGEPEASSYAEPTCKTCGCIEARACPGGCSWSKLDKKTNVGLCSTCAEQAKK